MGPINGSALRDFRRLNGWSLQDLADRTGINKGTISRIENGKIPTPLPGHISRLAKALGVDVASVTYPRENCPNCAEKATAA